MKKFQFRMAPALAARRTLLEAAQGELAEVQNRRQYAIELLEERRAGLLEAAGARSSESFDPASELLRQRHLKHLRDEIGRREHQILQLDTLVEQARDKVTEAYRDVRALEVLEEKDKAIWREETRREEQKENDDFGSQRHNR